MASLENCLIQFLTSVQIVKYLWYMRDSHPLPIIGLLVFLRDLCWVQYCSCYYLAMTCLIVFFLSKAFTQMTGLYTSYPGTLSPSSHVHAVVPLSIRIESV